MNTLGSLGARKNNNNQSSNRKSIIRPIVGAALISLGGTHTKSAEASEINLQNFEYSSSYYKENMELEKLGGDTGKKDRDINPSIRFNMLNSSQSIQDYEFNLQISEELDKTIQNISSLIGEYSLEYTSPDYITELPLPTFETDMKLFRQKISRHLDFNLGSKGCVDIFKGRRELEFRFGYKCNDVKTPGYSGNLRTHYTKIIDGITIHSPRSHCKIYKKRKGRDDKLMGNLNRQAQVDFLNYLDTQAFQKAYNESCITERKIREIMRWGRG